MNHSIPFWLAVLGLVAFGGALVSLLFAVKRGDLGRVMIEREFQRCIEHGGLGRGRDCSVCAGLGQVDNLNDRRKVKT